MESLPMKHLKELSLCSTALLTALLAGCTNDSTIPSPQALQGNCVGWVKNGNGAPVPGASVVLVPEQYAPLPEGKDAEPIDSTVSDANGRFGLTVTASGTYNFYAHTADGSVMHPSVDIAIDDRVVLDNETLQSPGSLSGTIHLQGMNDHRSAVILFIGANIYSVPDDSSGNFSVAALAPGLYRLRAIVPGNEFAAMETTITILSGEKVSLPRINLSGKSKPTVDKLEANYDSLMMTVTLTWKTPDTSLISGYRLYINRAKTILPVTSLAASCSTITFDIIDSPVDTFTYQITPIARNGAEGPTTESRTFVKKSFLTPAGVFNYRHPASFISPSLSVDRRQNMYITAGDYIAKYDSSGHFVASHSIQSGQSGEWYIFEEPRTDDTGNVYLIKGLDTSLVLLKFDPALNMTDDLTLEPGDYDANSFAVSGNGSPTVFFTDQWVGGGATRAIKYSPDFVKVKDIELARNIRVDEARFLRDTVICLTYDLSTDTSFITYYDTAFKSIGMLKEYAFLDGSIPAQFVLDPHPFPSYVGGDIFMIDAMKIFQSGGFRPVFLFFTGGKRVIARLPFSHTASPDAFDGQGNIYTLDSDNDKIYKYSTGLLSAAASAPVN